MPTYAHIQTDQTDAWYRVLKDSDLEHPEKAVDAYLYLDDLADIHRVTLIQRLYSSPEMAEMMLAKMDNPEDTLKTKKTLYVNKVGGLYPNPTESEIVETKNCPQRPLAKNQGFTGWLDATGQFHECTYGTHNEIAHNHNITDDDAAIYFACATSPISNSLTDVAETGYLKPTQAQLNWLETYKDQMSPTQREMLDID